MPDLFFFGTLQHLALLNTVLGHDQVVPIPATLFGHSVNVSATEQGLPVLIPDAAGQASGIFVAGLSDHDVARLDYYEGGYGYALGQITVQTADGARDAKCYLADHRVVAADQSWHLSDWARTWAETTTLAAAEFMEGYGSVPVEVAVTRVPMMMVRAGSIVRASGQSIPQELRAGPGREAIEVVEMRRPYSNFFTMVEQDFRFKKFNGQASNKINRAGMISGDAVTVLPYDPKRDRVMMIEQFRFGPWLRGDKRPWKLEPIAGRIDPGETPEEAVHREMQEEAGLSAKKLIEICNYYPSPGMVTEYLYTYLAIADLPDSVAGVAGLDEEDEDIKSHVLQFDRAMDLISSGEVEIGPLILSLLWLQGQRDAIRADA